MAPLFRFSDASGLVAHARFDILLLKLPFKNTLKEEKPNIRSGKSTMTALVLASFHMLKSNEALWYSVVSDLGML